MTPTNTWVSFDVSLTGNARHLLKGLRVWTRAWSMLDITDGRTCASLAGRTNGGPSERFALTIGSHGTRAVDSSDIPKSQLDLAGTSPYWAADIPTDMPQRKAELEGENKLNDVPPELRKSFRQRMEDLVSGKAQERKRDAGPLRQLADGIKAITGASDLHKQRLAEGSAWAGDGTVPPWKEKGFDAHKVLKAAAEVSCPPCRLCLS